MVRENLSFVSSLFHTLCLMSKMQKEGPEDSPRVPSPFAPVRGDNRASLLDVCSLANRTSQRLKRDSLNFPTDTVYLYEKGRNKFESTREERNGESCPLNA